MRIVALPAQRDDRRLDLLVHAGAQLEAPFLLELPAGSGLHDRMLRLADAYGIRERLSFGGGTGDASERIAVRLDGGESPSGKSTGNGDPTLGWKVESRAGTPQAPVRTLGELVYAFEERTRSDVPIHERRVSAEPLAGERIGVMTNVLTHYRVPLWNGMSRRLEEVGAKLCVFPTDAGPGRARPWLRHEEILFDCRPLTPGPLGGGAAFPADLERALRDFRPTLLLSPGFSPGVTGRTLRFAKRRGIPFLLWSGDTYRQPTARGRARRLERRWIAKRSTCGIAYGWLAAEYLRDLAPELPVVIGRNSAPFLPEPASGSGGERVEFLAVGQAIPRKGLDVVIDAFRLLDRDLRCGLTVAGGGPELAGLVARARGDERIRFLGAVESDRVLDCYREADAFLFPSRSDVFGLVLVEALGSGLATITAAAPASTADLAVHERNCLVVESHDPKVWAEAIRRVTEDATLPRRLAAAGRRTVLSRWTIEHSVEAQIAGFRLALLSARQGDEHLEH
jgi:glycosyltransferase involved in cell wall biosynthesis